MLRKKIFQLSFKPGKVGLTFNEKCIGTKNIECFLIILPINFLVLYFEENDFSF